MARDVLTNTRRILAIEWLAASQAIDLARCADELATATRAAHSALRDAVPALHEDRFMADDIAAAAEALRAGTLQSALDHVSIRLA